MNRVQATVLFFAASTLLVSGSVLTDGVVNLTKKTYGEAVRTTYVYEIAFLIFFDESVILTETDGLQVADGKLWFVKVRR